MTPITKSQEREKKAKVKAKLREYKISLKSIEERSSEIRKDGRRYHRNTVCAAFNAYNEYYSVLLMELADKMIQEKETLIAEKGN